MIHFLKILNIIITFKSYNFTLNLPLFTKKVQEISEFSKLKGQVECDQPNCNIYSVNGTVLIHAEGDSSEKRAFLKIDNVFRLCFTG